MTIPSLADGRKFKRVSVHHLVRGSVKIGIALSMSRSENAAAGPPEDSAAVVAPAKPESAA